MIKIFGEILNLIFELVCNIQDKLGIISHSGSVGISFIIFTLIIYLIAIPFLYSQQKYNIMQGIMAKEIKAATDKYAPLMEIDSQRAKTALQYEKLAINAKYGISSIYNFINIILQFIFFLLVYQIIGKADNYIIGIGDNDPAFLLGGININKSAVDVFYDPASSLLFSLRYCLISAITALITLCSTIYANKKIFDAISSQNKDKAKDIEEIKKSKGMILTMFGMALFSSGMIFYIGIKFKAGVALYMLTASIIKKIIDATLKKYIYHLNIEKIFEHNEKAYQNKLQQAEKYIAMIEKKKEDNSVKIVEREAIEA
ncbi:YidC/Oxa1 family membrane protein insertase [Butyrivibrio fibrisolvens]|uniref:YidC/Oxa1 family membrane protein insertase n=1 Tax=Butyrivibrio fibrisolvens TaxID=831 RepID=UPI0003B484F2|nr:YidC/Oxa1 family membrane protein insertase [Butyrivibrio fibrisolvens]